MNAVFFEEYSVQCEKLGSENHHLDLLEFCVLGNIKQNPNTQSLSQTGKRTAFRGPELL